MSKKKIISKQKEIYYIFSSITHLQLYIPLVIEFSKINYKNIFIIRESLKSSHCPINNKQNYKILLKYSNEYNFKIVTTKNIILEEIIGIIFMVDGDITGRNFILKNNNSYNLLLNKDNTLKISLVENINFKLLYKFYINDIDYCIFSNINCFKQFENVSKIYKKDYNIVKNLYLGNTKFDNIITKKLIYSKYNLSNKKKYCLILYPKIIVNNNDKLNLQFLDNIYSYLKLLDFEIIVKTRPKDNNIPDRHKGILTICSNYFPNESLELMKISDLCIMFSSSANEEALFMKMPCIDFSVDYKERNDYLLNEKTCIRLYDWENFTYQQFKNIFDKLAKKSEVEIFSKLKKKYIFNHKSSSKNYIKFLIENNYIKL